MKKEKKVQKTHTKASLNLYLVAGLYLLYLDYSLLKDWSIKPPNEKVIVTIMAIAFGAFAIGIMTFSLKRIVAMTRGNDK